MLFAVVVDMEFSLELRLADFGKASA